MMRAALFGVAIAAAITRPAAATDYFREELRIPMAAAGPLGLEALLIRPSEAQRYPLAVISHGTSADGNVRQALNPYAFYRQAIEFARRGFAALVVIRRGFGGSGGDYADRNGCCTLAGYLRTARASADDLRAAISAMKRRDDVTTQGMIAIGVSTGGFATIALTADPPQGLVAAINFAGGFHRASLTGSGIRNAADETALVNAFKALGGNSRIPQLWVYADNDTFFPPDLARRLFAGFTGSGGRAQLIDAPSIGSDGHFLFSAGIPLWTKMVDDFLRERNLGGRDPLPTPSSAALAPPPLPNEKGRAGFEDYLAAVPHKAFAVSPKGAFGYRSGLRSAAEALGAALAGCGKHASDCAPYAIDDQLAGKASGGSL